MIRVYIIEPGHFFTLCGNLTERSYNPNPNENQFLEKNGGKEVATYYRDTRTLVSTVDVSVSKI